MHLNQISGQVVDAAMKIHTSLGPGLLESVYEVCLARELENRGFKVVRQLGLPVCYGGSRVDLGFRMDLLVNNSVVVEVKSVDALSPIHKAQLLTYLRLSDHRLGLLINFNEVHLRDGIRRLVNNLEED